jgi:hypothetical protein
MRDSDIFWQSCCDGLLFVPIIVVIILALLTFIPYLNIS